MNDAMKHFESLVDDFSNGMLVTKHDPGVLRARPMHVADYDDAGKLWFLTDRDSAKVDELEDDSRVAVTFQDGQRFVSITGLADVVTDPVRIGALWNPAWRLWFPNGKEAHGLVAVRVTPIEGEYWDNSGVVNKLKFAKQAVEAILTGSTPDVDDPAQHGHVAQL